MARQEQPREDLLAEATGLVERISLLLPGANPDEEIVAGFRRDGSLALFFGQQRVYQFTSAGALRRAFVGDVLYKAQAGKLVAMQRERSAEAVLLVSHPLDMHATASFLSEMRGHLQTLKVAIKASRLTVRGQVPTDGNVLARVLIWLASRSGPIEIADSPRTK